MLKRRITLHICHFCIKNNVWLVFNFSGYLTVTGLTTFVTYIRKVERCLQGTRTRRHRKLLYCMTSKVKWDGIEYACRYDSKSNTRYVVIYISYSKRSLWGKEDLMIRLFLIFNFINDDKIQSSPLQDRTREYFIFIVRIQTSQ